MYVYSTVTQNENKRINTGICDFIRLILAILEKNIVKDGKKNG